MPPPRRAFVEVYVFRRRRAVEFLCLRRAPGERLGGVWQPVTGRRRRRESAFAAARREVREETGLSPLRWWMLEAPTFFLHRRTGEVVALPLFAAEVPSRATPRLSREHDRVAFLSAPRAGRRFLWEAQRRALGEVRRQVLAGGRLADALAIGARRAPARRRPRGGAAGRA